MVTRHSIAFALSVVSTLLWTPAALGQDPGHPTEGTGYELALQGAVQVRAGRVARFHGVAYEVQGLASLSAFEGSVRARIGRQRGVEARDWVHAASDSDGRFFFEVPVPLREGEESGDHRLQVEVGPQGQARRFEFTVEIVSAIDLTLRADRRLYEAGETLHIWARLADLGSGVPLSGQPIGIEISGDAIANTAHTLVSDGSGIASLDITLPETLTEESAISIFARVPGQGEQTLVVRLGTRTYPRLFATLEVDPEPVRPGGMGRANVFVRSANGAPVSGALVSTRVGDSPAIEGRTDLLGRARIDLRAPAYVERSTTRLPVNVAVRAPSLGVADAHGMLELDVPRALQVELLPVHGGLVPGVEQTLYLRLADGAGRPPAAGTDIRVQGAAIVSGPVSGSTDANGLVQVRVRLSRGASVRVDETFSTMVSVVVGGALATTLRLPLRALPDAELAFVVQPVVAEPGAHVEVTLSRGPSARGLPVMVELLDSRGELLRVVRATPTDDVLRIDLPSDHLGLLSLRARAVHADESLEGRGVIGTLIVRPPAVDAIEIVPQQGRWSVGETARLSLRTGAGGPRRYAALLIRDLAAHGGEFPFDDQFINRAFERALLLPHGALAETLLRASLAAEDAFDARPQRAGPLVNALGIGEASDPPSGGWRERGTLRDPWPLARELSRRGVARAMRLAESRLESALAAGNLGSVTAGSGLRRIFDRADLNPSGRLVSSTLGGLPLNAAVLEDADPSFNYHSVSRRVGRARLVRLIVALSRYLDPGDDASPAAQMAARQPHGRWLASMVRQGLLRMSDLDDPWGTRFSVRANAHPIVALGARSLELVSPGPDGRFGTSDDLRDPFARAVPRGTPYALASGEDSLIRRLAAHSTFARAIEAIARSYQRVSAEVVAERIGDAVSLDDNLISLGAIGTMGRGGGGGGTGAGYGRGMGSMRGRRGRVPRIRLGASSVLGLGAVIRHHFPPTLFFRPSIELDQDGITEVAIPLSDAITTYLIEAILWREDGWVTSSSTRIRVEREVVVDAPVPTFAHRGDVLTMPISLSNRGPRERRVALRLLGDEGLGIEDSGPRNLVLAPGQSVSVPIAVTPQMLGRGHLRAVVTSPAGVALDAISRPLRVLASGRQVTRVFERIAEGQSRLAFDVPEGATAVASTLMLDVGQALFSAEEERAQPAERGPLLSGGYRMLLAEQVYGRAASIGSAWADPEVDDADLQEAVDTLGDRLGNLDRTFPEDTTGLVAAQSWMLLGLSSALSHPQERSGVTGVPELAGRLREALREAALGDSENIVLMAFATGALGWTLTDTGDNAPVSALRRRLQRYVVQVGEDTWLATQEHPVLSTLLLSMAELSTGARAEALQRLMTVVRHRSHQLGITGRGIGLQVGGRVGGQHSAQSVPVSRGEHLLGRAILRRLFTSTVPETTSVLVDGRPRVLPLEGGSGMLRTPHLATEGAHEVRFETPHGLPYAMRVSTRYTLPWARPSRERGPFELALSVAERSEPDESEGPRPITIEIRNRLPATLSRPVLDVQLPAGAYLPAGSAERLGLDVRVAHGVLSVRLPPMRPGSARTIELPLRFRIDGDLRGLGLSAYSADRPEHATSLAPTTLRVRGLRWLRGLRWQARRRRSGADERRAR